MMAAAIQTVKRVLGVKEAASAVEHATELVSDAREALEKVQTRQADAVAKAQAAFDESGTDDAADALAHAERRAEILLRAAREKLAVAEALLKNREREARDAKIAELDALVSSHNARLTAEIVPELEGHVRGIAALLKRADEMKMEAHRAAIEVENLRGPDPNGTRKGIRIAALNTSRSLRHLVADRLGRDFMELRSWVD